MANQNKKGRWQVTDNELILVDIFDRETGRMSKETAHRRPYLHRAFSIFLYQEHKILLQKRAAEKYHSGHLWANACCSHPRWGETLAEASQRRLQEELGIACPLQELTSFVYLHQFGAELYEYEYDHILLGQYAGPLKPNPDEIAEIAWLEITDLAQDLRAQPGRYAPWFE